MRVTSDCPWMAWRGAAAAKYVLFLASCKTKSGRKVSRANSWAYGVSTFKEVVVLRSAIFISSDTVHRM